MRAVNPAFIPRNHLVEEALSAAVNNGDLSAFETLLTVLGCVLMTNCQRLRTLRRSTAAGSDRAPDVLRYLGDRLAAVTAPSNATQPARPRNPDEGAPDVSAMPGYEVLRKYGMDMCGVAQLASRTVGVPCVGRTTGTPGDLRAPSPAAWRERTLG